MNAIVERLRHVADCGIPDFTNSKLLDEAADHIEALERGVRKLQARIETLEAALREIMALTNNPENDGLAIVKVYCAAAKGLRAARDKDAKTMSELVVTIRAIMAEHEDGVPDEVCAAAAARIETLEAVLAFILTDPPTALGQLASDAEIIQHYREVVRAALDKDRK
jgi:hypothetical protein